MQPPFEVANPDVFWAVCGGRVKEVYSLPYLRLPGTCRFVACQICETVFDSARLLV
jgi:hypothetical protein